MSLIVKIKKQLDNFMLSVDMELTDEVVSVIGMSGSGKSMTLKCIAGIETPDSGFISLNGRVLYVCWFGMDNPGQSPRVPIFCVTLHKFRSKKSWPHLPY